METKIYAVIDTNVIVSALFSISGQSNPAAIIRKVVDGTITPIFNEEILAEYKEVLSKEDSFLVTGNLKHFPTKPFGVSPAEMVAIISEMQEIGNRILSEAGAWYGKRGKGL